LNHEATKNTKEDKTQTAEKDLHRNNAAEWVIFALLYPVWLAAVAWIQVRRFVSFVASWFKRN
jgi:hypothetical protein